MGGYTTYTTYRTAMAGTYTIRLTAAAPDAATTKFYLEITGGTIATTMDAAACVVLGVAASTSTAADWKGSDVTLISLTSATNTVSLTTASSTAPFDASCKTTTATATANTFCSFQGYTSAEANQNWVWVTGAAVASDKAAYASGILKIEFQRPNALGDPNVDLAIVPGTSKIDVAYLPMACPTVDADLAGLGIAQFDLSVAAPTANTYPMSTTGGTTNTTGTTGTTTKSFGNLTYLSWFSLLISYALLN